jgi:tetratricopeptide (TPR) repeat protein
LAAIIVAAALVVVTLAVWFPVTRAAFINLDDNVYVTENRHVASGLTAEGIRWAFTNGHAGLWHPLAWLSHMLDVQLFGLDPAGHHATSLVLHVANVALLFLLLRRMTRATWPPVVAAALFALHPLRVESVAWVAERKDVLSVFFGFVALHAYVSYTAARSLGRYVLVLLAFACAVMAKPMLVTLPAVMLLLDYWPLRRFGERETIETRAPSWIALVVEKLPLVAVAVISAVATLLAAREQSALVGLGDFSLRARVTTAVVSYASYLRKAVWPIDLSVYYPLAGPPGTYQVAGSALLLVGVTAFAFFARRRSPYLLVGWLWFVGTLLPVSGILQTGGQAIADRFTYLPLAGLFVAVAWAVSDVRWPSIVRTVLGVATVAGIALLAVATRRDLAHWQDGVALFSRALEVTQDNWLAHDSLGDALVKKGDFEAASTQFEAALRLSPDDAKIHYDLGVARVLQGQLDEGGSHFVEALRLRPGFADAEFNIGQILARQVRYEEAIVYLEQAVRHDPSSANAHAGYGTALLHVGKIDEAITELLEATRLDPRHAIAHFNLARVFAAQGKAEEAGVHFDAAFAADPSLRPPAAQ